MFQGYVGKIIGSNTKHELTNLDAPHALEKTSKLSHGFSSWWSQPN